MIKKILNNELPTIAPDKLGHFFYGTLLSFAIYFVLPIIYVPIIVFAVSLVKELWDKYKRNKQFSIMDLIYNNITSVLLYATSFFY